MQLFEIDKAILKIFNQPINPSVNNFMLFLNYSVYVYLALLLVYYYKKRVGIFFWKKRREKFLQLVFNSSVGITFVYFLKYLIGRPRPSADEFIPIIQKLDPSFPSSHVFISFLCLSFLPKEISRWLKIFSTIYLAIGIPVSAMYLGIHYPSDIFAGALLGIIFPLVLTERISKIIIQRIYRIREKLLSKIF
jgi:undecaprenyl-diphosphatase